LKAIVATGFGKLHFHETARALAAAGVEVNFLTGWVPRDNQTALVELLGKSIGEKNLARRMAGRRIRIPGVSVTPVAWVEVAGTFIRLVQRSRVIPLDLAYGMEFRLAAWGSRKYLHDADVLLVRSGAGQSGAIKRARDNGLCTGSCVKSLPVSVCRPGTTHERIYGSSCCAIARMLTCSWSTPTS
jgi:hypothetical protein